MYFPLNYLNFFEFLKNHLTTDVTCEPTEHQNNQKPKQTI